MADRGHASGDQLNARIGGRLAKHVSQTKGAAFPGTRYHTPRMVFARRQSAQTRTGSPAFVPEAEMSVRGIARQDA